MGADFDPLPPITDELERLARDGTLTFARFLDLLTQASQMANGDASLLSPLTDSVRKYNRTARSWMRFVTSSIGSSVMVLIN